jgi:hypothetical protein
MTTASERLAILAVMRRGRTGRMHCSAAASPRNQEGEPSAMPTFKLRKADRKKIMEAAKRAEEPAAALTAAVEAYNEVLGVIRTLVRGMEVDWQADWDKRSERWQDGATGQAVADTITAWSAFGDELEDIQIDLPAIVIPEND